MLLITESIPIPLGFMVHDSWFTTVDSTRNFREGG